MIALLIIYSIIGVIVFCITLYREYKDTGILKVGDLIFYSIFGYFWICIAAFWIANSILSITDALNHKPENILDITILEKK